ncbi:MAG: helix-turn-helix domain-containing protein [Saprospiraceae bacterium]
MKNKKAFQEVRDLFLKQVGQHLKERRLEQGTHSKEGFAYSNGLGRSQYDKYEKGGNMYLDTLLRILLVHNIKFDEFFAEFDWSEIYPTPSSTDESPS